MDLGVPLFLGNLHIYTLNKNGAFKHLKSRVKSGPGRYTARYTARLSDSTTNMCSVNLTIRRRVQSDKSAQKSQIQSKQSK